MKFKANLNEASFKAVVNKIKDLATPMGAKVAKEVGETVVDLMKTSIEAGNSPIAGRGKFQAYRGEYRKGIIKRGYVSQDGTRYKKSLTPVNLKVSGKFLDSLKATVQRTKNGYAVVIGLSGNLSNKKEEGHRSGHNGQAERPIIPQEGEKFSQAIQRVYLDIINDAIAVIAKRK